MVASAVRFMGEAHRARAEVSAEDRHINIDWGLLGGSSTWDPLQRSKESRPKPRLMVMGHSRFC